MIDKSVEMKNAEWHGFVVIEEEKNCLKVEADIFKSESYVLNDIKASELVNYLLGMDNSLKS
uniref:Uncharacterized protein n=1 Tax=Meloidogyne enterolobii TaxID=390850 RepID=A0A6V7VRP0_MELEN|nr:unnamed protein product [Meloidogyne enterolobii]